MSFPQTYRSQISIGNLNSFQKPEQTVCWISLVPMLTLSEDFTNHVILPLSILLLQMLFFTVLAKNLPSPSSASGYGT